MVWVRMWVYGFVGVMGVFLSRVYVLLWVGLVLCILVYG